MFSNVICKLYYAIRDVVIRDVVIRDVVIKDSVGRWLWLQIILFLLG
jgi:hypothetical protein